MRTLALVALGLALSCAACAERAATQLSAAQEVVVADAGSAADAGADAGFTDDGGCSCQSWGPAQNAGLLGDPELVELSGLAASWAHPGVMWAHNDSGDTARFFALAEDGAARGRFGLPGVAAKDIEDVAVGPCPQGACVYLADFGDNLTVRDDTTVYRVAEPPLDADAGLSLVPVSFERFDFAYPSGLHHNAETLVVHPVTGDVYVLTKHGAGVKSRVYRFPRPLNAAAKVTLEFVAELPVPASGDLPLSGGDLSPCGNALLLRLYNRVVELKLAAGQPFESIFTQAPRSLPTPIEPQGEAVAWRRDGRAFFTASEGSSQQLHRVDCP